MTNSKVRVAAVGDLHFGEINPPNYGPLFQEISHTADVLLLCGDLTQRGTVADMRLGIEQLQSCTIPILAVLGNHDFEGGEFKQIATLLKQNRIQVLHGEASIVNEVAFVGVKGFCGGFDSHMMSPFGEKIVKDYAQESINEALLLEKALSSVSQIERKVVLLHYSPIRTTVEGEHPDIMPFLGSSRLADPIDRFQVNAVFHGHAHHGTPEGKTTQQVPVYNVAFPLMMSLNKEHPYKLIMV